MSVSNLAYMFLIEFKAMEAVNKAIADELLAST